MPRYLTVIALLALVATGCARNRGEMPADTLRPEVTATLPAAATSEAPTMIAETATAAATPVPLDCASPAEGSVEWVACNVAAGLRSRNLSALHGSMTDPFSFGLWRSEGRADSPANVTRDLPAQLPADPATPLSFTVDRAGFPDLGGLPVESLMGADAKIVLVVASAGWGQDGAGEALLFFAEDDAGKPRWQGLLLAPAGFE
jgi:hypothetical protein